MDDGHGHHGGLKKVLNVRDLTFMGIAAVVGAGIFSTIGTAAFNGGPGISLLFVITDVTWRSGGGVNTTCVALKELLSTSDSSPNDRCNELATILYCWPLAVSGK